MNNVRRAALTLPALILAVTVAGCDLLSPSDNNMRDQLAQAEQIWRQAAITSYSMTTQVARRTDEVVPTVTVTVANRQITSIVDATSGEAYPTTGDIPYRTVEGVFDIIRDAISRRAAGLHVQYDREYAFPVIVQIDYDPVRVDDDLLITIGNFTPTGS